MGRGGGGGGMCKLSDKPQTKRRTTANSGGNRNFRNSKCYDKYRYIYLYIHTYDIPKIFEPGTNVIKFSYSSNLMKMCGVLQVAIG